VRVSHPRRPIPQAVCASPHRVRVTVACVWSTIACSSTFRARPPGDRALRLTDCACKTHHSRMPSGQLRLSFENPRIGFDWARRPFCWRCSALPLPSPRSIWIGPTSLAKARSRDRSMNSEAVVKSAVSSCRIGCIELRISLRRELRKSVCVLPSIHTLAPHNEYETHRSQSHEDAVGTEFRKRASVSMVLRATFGRRIVMADLTLFFIALSALGSGVWYAIASEEMV
jgi:hypothetical protein